MFRRISFALTPALLLGLAVLTGCPDARNGCQSAIEDLPNHPDYARSDEVQACMDGAGDATIDGAIGGRSHTLVQGKTLCRQKYSINNVDPNSPTSYQDANRMADDETACVWGVKAHLYYDEHVPKDQLDGGVGPSAGMGAGDDSE
jgi:hypothetical protein